MGLLNTIWGKKLLQPVFERMRSASLKGLNYGRASDYRHNGERFVMQFVRSKTTHSHPVIFDVGANQGAFTRELVEIFRDTAFDIYAFEPSTAAFAKLREAVPPTDNIRLIQQGLGEVSGKAELHFDREGSGLASLYERNLSHRNISFARREVISITTLDEFCVAHQIQNIDFLKLDVEGHELAVLRGGKEMFANKRIRFVQFEFGGCNIDSRTFFRDYFQFFDSDFELYRVLSNGLTRIEKYTERLEVFDSANYLAVRKN